MPHLFAGNLLASRPRRSLASHTICTGAAKALVEGFGGKLDSYYLALGEDDGVAICEFPANKAAVACSMSATASGGFSRFETTTPLTAQEAEAAMKQANQTKTGYKPPNA